MKFSIILISTLLFLSFHSYAQDRIVLNSDTLTCHIDSIHSRGVNFTYEGDSKLASLDLVKSIYIGDRWRTNAEIRGMVVSGYTTAPVPESIMARKIAASTPSSELIRAGKNIQISAVVLVIGGVLAALLAKDRPGIAIGIVGVASLTSLIAILSAGSNLRWAGVAMAR